MKKCTKCKQFKLEDEFHKDRTRWDGLNSKCKDCNHKKQSERLADVPYSLPRRNIGVRTSVTDPYTKCVYSWNYDGQGLGIPGQMSVQEWKALLATYGYSCGYCGWKEGMLSPDHYYPKSWYKNPDLKHLVNSNVTNCIPACVYCNSAKGNRDPDEFKRWLHHRV